MSAPWIRDPGPFNSIGARGPASFITGVSSACAGMRSLAKSAKSEMAITKTLFFIRALQSQSRLKKLLRLQPLKTLCVLDERLGIHD